MGLERMLKLLVLRHPIGSVRRQHQAYVDKAALKLRWWCLLLAAETEDGSKPLLLEPIEAASSRGAGPNAS